MKLIVFNDKYWNQPTPYFQELLEDIKSFQPKLVILDKDLDFFGGDENNRCQHRQFIKCCARIAKTANCAVLLCKQGANVEMWFNRAWYLLKSEEASDERLWKVKSLITLSKWGFCNLGCQF
ncbi:MAG: AAA family ATPase [Wolbachia sp.]